MFEGNLLRNLLFDFKKGNTESCWFSLRSNFVISEGKLVKVSCSHNALFVIPLRVFFILMQKKSRKTLHKNALVGKNEMELKCREKKTF